LFVDYKINEQKGKGKEKNQGSRGEKFYKDNNNNSFLSLNGIYDCPLKQTPISLQQSRLTCK
jgi:hypothetical protein